MLTPPLPLRAVAVSAAMAVIGAVLIGAVLAPLGTYYSLVLDTLAPPKRRAEVFALLRTANAVGVILVSSDSRELADLSDRVLSLVDGTITGELVGDQVTTRACVEAAYGISAASAATFEPDETDHESEN